MNDELKEFIGNKSHTLAFRRTTEELDKLLKGEEQEIEIRGIKFTVKRKG